MNPNASRSLDAVAALIMVGAISCSGNRFSWAFALAVALVVGGLVLVNRPG